MHLPTWAVATLFYSIVAADRSFSTVTGYFTQDDPGTNSATFDPTSTNFGLKPLNDKPSNTADWQYFCQQVADMNAAANSSTSYKVIFMARHGEGVHNVAEEYYGPVEWYGYWAERDGNGTATWMDAHLTAHGIEQAQQLGQAWQQQISVQKTPAPQSYYTSPLDRCCDTARYTFGDLSLPVGATAFVPTVKEKLREILGLVTENKRSNKTYISSQFPTYEFEDGFTEDDELWKSYEVELPWRQDARLGELLDDVFSNDDNTFISFTSHQLSTESMLRVIGHQPFTLETAGMLPVLIESVVS